MKAHGASEQLIREIPEALSELLGETGYDVREPAEGAENPDLIVQAAGKLFVVEYKQSSAAAHLAYAAQLVKRLSKKFSRNAIPLLAVPFMGEAGARVCADAEVGWLDLSGNARIVAPGIRVIVQGNPNRFLPRGRPPNIFAPKSSRIIRWLLLHPNESFTQREMAKLVDLDEGFVSKITSRLESAGYVSRPNGSAIQVRNPSLLIEDWREAYVFSRHTIHAGHIAARSSELLLSRVCSALSSRKMQYALTGLAGAWEYTRFAGYRLVSLYTKSDPSQELIEALGFKEGTRGANLWLVVPNDDGVFHGSVTKGKFRCASPIQVYLDLKGHPERASEAAERLKKELLNWNGAD